MIRVFLLSLWVSVIAEPSALVAPEAGKEPPRATVVSDETVRAAVAKSLPFLETNGVAWMTERECMSCHHVPFLVWSHRSALRHGVTIDEKKLSEWEAWCRQNSADSRNRYRLQKYELGKVAEDMLPNPVREKLSLLIDKPFHTQTEFRDALRPLLTDDELKLHETVIARTAEHPLNHPDRSGGGLDVIAQLLLASQGSSNELTKAEFRRGLIDLMQELQRPDGSWMPGNQLLSMRRMSVPVADQSTTMWVALALAACETDRSQRSAILEKALFFARQPSPAPNNHEWLATRLLFEKTFGTTADIETLRQQLLSVRNSDGGWSWEPQLPSDPLSTGLAIYVLANVGGDHADIFGDARRYLLSTQHTDGSWPTPGRSFSNETDPVRLKGRDEIYHYWGTAWTTIGLLETLR